jgi:capsular exopolysaccharide synthesis family protein
MTLDNNNTEFLEDGIDLRQYLSLFWHWAWLIALAAVVAGVAAYVMSKRTTPYYQSSTTVLVNEAPATKTTDYSSVMLSEQLTSTYAEMMTKDPVLNEVIGQLGLSISAGKLKSMITVAPVRDTQLIQITAETTQPQLSADVANSIAAVFSKQIMDIQGERFAQSKATLEAQMAEIETQIASYEAQAEGATSADEREQLDAKVTQYREIYSGLLTSYESVRLSEAQSISSVTQVERATANSVPVRPKTLQNTLLAAVVGVMLVAGGLVAKEAMDDTIKTPEDIISRFGLPILGVINHLNGKRNDPITLADPASPTSEAYRTLRTNVSHASLDGPLRTLLVTSAEPGEGKTTTLGNLAVVMAQNGLQVIVADCDLRHPRTHIQFRLNNRKGLTNLFEQPSYVLDGSCQVSGVQNLSVVTSGSLPGNPAELLGSERMRAIIQAMAKEADVVLVDTPPALAVTDAAVLAPSVDGVLLVVKPGKTRARAVKRTLELLAQVQAKVVGVVLNDVTTHRSSYGYHYKYYRNYAAYQKYYGNGQNGNHYSKKK